MKSRELGPEHWMQIVALYASTDYFYKQLQIFSKVILNLK